MSSLAVQLLYAFYEARTKQRREAEIIAAEGGAEGAEGRGVTGGEGEGEGETKAPEGGRGPAAGGGAASSKKAKKGGGDEPEAEGAPAGEASAPPAQDDSWGAFFWLSPMTFGATGPSADPEVPPGAGGQGAEARDDIEMPPKKMKTPKKAAAPKRPGEE